MSYYSVHGAYAFRQMEAELSDRDDRIAQYRAAVDNPPRQPAGGVQMEEAKPVLWYDPVNRLVSPTQGGPYTVGLVRQADYLAERRARIEAELKANAPTMEPVLTPLRNDVPRANKRGTGDSE